MSWKEFLVALFVLPEGKQLGIHLDEYCSFVTRKMFFWSVVQGHLSRNDPVFGITAPPLYGISRSQLLYGALIKPRL